MTMVWMLNSSPQFCVDGLKDENDEYFGRFDNPANLFNHSFISPNCQLSRRGRGMTGMTLFVQTITEIPAHTELVWKYAAGYDKELPGWFYAS